MDPGVLLADVDTLTGGGGGGRKHENLDSYISRHIKKQFSWGSSMASGVA